MKNESTKSSGNVFTDLGFEYIAQDNPSAARMWCCLTV